MLHTRKTALGIGLMSLRTTMSALALKLHLGRNRYESELSRVIRINEENVKCFCGHSRDVFHAE